IVKDWGRMCARLAKVDDPQKLSAKDRDSVKMWQKFRETMKATEKWGRGNVTVSISKMSIGYYLDSAVSNDADISGASNGLTAYYTETQTPPGVWFGRGLDGIGVAEGSTVDGEQAIRLYEEGANPLTGETLGRRMQIPSSAPAAATTPRGRLAMGTGEGVAGFDLTFSVPKSVSTLWALGDYGLQTRLEAAHRPAMP